MEIGEIMSRRVGLIDQATMIAAAARQMRDDDVGCLLVGRRDRLLGIVTGRDIVGSLCIKERNATQSLGRGADQAAAREGRSPNESRSFSSEKSYSPKRLTWAHESME